MNDFMEYIKSTTNRQTHDAAASAAAPIGGVETRTHVAAEYSAAMKARIAQLQGFATTLVMRQDTGTTASRIFSNASIIWATHNPCT